MKPVFKCDYCEFMGTEEDVKNHENTCINNYDKRSCYTCEHRGVLTFVNGIPKYKCDKEIDIPEGTIFEFCKSYERKKETHDRATNFIKDIFGMF